MLKVGDKVAINRWTGTESKPGRVLTVVRVTKTLAICDNGDRRKINEEPSSPGRIKEAEAVMAEKKRRSKEAERQRQAEILDPKYPFLRRLKGGGDFEPWELLPMDKLETITKWLDEAKVAQRKESR